MDERAFRFVVLANPLRRCGVHLAAAQHALTLQCPLVTEPSAVSDCDFVYLHWHPNFEWQHPKWAMEVRALKVPAVLVVHDFLFTSPVSNTVAIVAFDVRVAGRDVIEIPMPLQQPYPFLPRTQPDPDRVGFFGFYGPNKGLWTILDYARQHKRVARFITTLHPFSPSWIVSEFNEFVSTAKRLNMEVIADWLEGQELADVMGECGFFICLHSGTFGASGSVTSALAVQRPVFAKKSRFFKHAERFISEFVFDRYPTEGELQAEMEKVKQAENYLNPKRIWSALHAKLVDFLSS